MTPGVPFSAPSRSGAALQTLERIDRLVREVAVDRGAREVQYPVLLARETLERAEYPRAFPHLLISTTAGAGVQRPPTPERTSLANRGDGASKIPGAPDETEWCLSPAVCFHTYAALAGRQVRAPQAVTARSRCFRRERNTLPGVRQIEFEMREIVLAGSKAWVERTVDTLRVDVEALARGLALDGSWEAAEDPFFLPSAPGKALMQRLCGLKREYVVKAHGHTIALASVNRHVTFFGERFGIRLRDGTPAHTACVAVGLDRWQHCADRGRPEVRS